MWQPAVLDLMKDTFSEWNKHKAPQMGAAMAYFALFSLGPLLVVVITMAGLVFGEEAARGEIVHQIEGVVGEEAAQAIQAAIASAHRENSGVVGALFGGGGLLLGASGLFAQLRGALNTIWEVQPQPASGLLGVVKQQAVHHAVSFTMVLVAGFLLLLLLIAFTLLGIFAELLDALMPGLSVLVSIGHFAVSLGVVTLLFAMVYKILPDADIPWSDVWIGAGVTALLFVMGQVLMGVYFAYVDVGLAYGTANSLVVLLVWVFYSAQVFLFGAELTRAYARKYGRHGEGARQERE